MGQALSVLGTVVGIVAGLATVWSLARRRDHVRVTTDTVMGRPAEARLEITATNVGTHAVTLVAMGYVMAQPAAEPRVTARAWRAVQRPFLRRRLRAARHIDLLPFEDGNPARILLQPSDQSMQAVDLADLTDVLGAGESAWGYVRTSAGREIFDNRPASLYRWSGDSWTALP